MQDEVHTRNVFVFFRLADHVREVGTHVEFAVDFDLFVVAVFQVVNVRGQNRDTRDDVKCVFVDVFPRGIFVELTGAVKLVEYGVFLHGQNTGGEHGHWVRVNWHRADDFKYVVRYMLTCFEFQHHGFELLFVRYFAGQQEEPEYFNGRVV